MTENLLQKLEEKMMVLLAEVESLRKDVQRLNHENAALRIERESSAKRLQDFIALLDSVETPLVGSLNANVANVAVSKPVLVQG